jgi:hypothetical protein
VKETYHDAPDDVETVEEGSEEEIRQAEEDEQHADERRNESRHLVASVTTLVAAARAV